MSRSPVFGSLHSVALNTARFKFNSGKNTTQTKQNYIYFSQTEIPLKLLNRYYCCNIMVLLQMGVAQVSTETCSYILCLFGLGKSWQNSLYFMVMDTAAPFHWHSAPAERIHLSCL